MRLLRPDAGLDGTDFLSAASGMAVLVAMIRSFSRRNSEASAISGSI